MAYDPKVLEVKVKRRIRLYAKISFWMTFITLSATFTILIVAMFGKLQIKRFQISFENVKYNLLD